MSLAKILKDSRYLIGVFTPHIDETLDDILFADILKYVGGQMKLSHEELQVAANSVKRYKYQVLTKELLQSIVLRLLANKKFFKELVEAPYWDGTAADSVVLCRGISYEPVKRGSRQLVLHCIALTGVPAGVRFLVKKSADQLNYFMYKFMHTGREGYEAEEIAKLLFRCTLEEQSKLFTDIKNISVTPFIKEHNKRILLQRYEPLKCKTPNKLCWACKKTILECPLACRYKEANETIT